MIKKITKLELEKYPAINNFNQKIGQILLFTITTMSATELRA
jgi:hypothetical protein